MKHLINARAAAAGAMVVALAAALLPTAAHGQVAVTANWVQTTNQGPSARGGSSMAYDSARRRSVLFGGSDGSFSYFSDTWQYDGASWTQLQVAGPQARYLGLMAYDSARSVTVLFGGYNNGVLNDTWEWDGTAWTRKLPAHTPPTRLWSAMTYDSARHVTVLFGGAIDTGLFNDTWQYDGTDWTQVTTSHSPPARRGHALAYDPTRAVTVLFGGQDPTGVDLNDTWEFNGSDWNQVMPTGAPPARIWPAMAYDPNLGGTVIFGGAIGTSYAPVNDTWLYDGSSWQQIARQVNLSARFYVASAFESNRGDFVMFGGSVIAGGASNFGDTWSLQGVTTSAVDWAQSTPATAPTARVFSQMDYDSARGVSVLFGGSSDSGPGNLHDTWEWDGARWTQMAPAASPPAVAAGMMAYDSSRGVSVLFGGSGSTGSSSSTWEWDGTSWTQKSPATSPPARVWAAMTYDSARGRMVLFGGYGPNGLLADTWTYDGITWTQMNPASSPSPRYGPALAFDPSRGRAVLFGGHDSNSRLADTWEWDGVNWTQVPTTMAPAPRFWYSLAFDTQRGKTVLFGGDHFLPYDLGESNDTWEWDGSQWTPDFTAAAPTIRSGQGTAYDSARGRLVVFGGWNAATSPVTIYGDTWELGSGIQTAAGTPVGNLQQNGTLNFGNVFVGSTSQTTQTYAAFRLTNTGTGPLTVNSITVTGADFPVTNYCPVAGNPLAAGSSCMTLVVFTPTAAGPLTGSITFSYNTPGGNRTFQLQGTGVLHPTTVTVSPATALFNGTTSITASLASNGSALAGQTLTFTLPNGATTSIQTNAQGFATWAGASLAGIHAGAYPTGIQATFAGSPGYDASSASASLTVTQPVSTAYTGDFYIADSSGGNVAIKVDQRTAASDTRFIDYASNVVWARFTVTGPTTSTDLYARVTDASDWSTSGLGLASAGFAPLPDGAYTVIVTLVDGSGSSTPSALVTGDDVRIGLVSSPVKGGYLSGGGAIAADPSANTSDTHGYFSFQMKPGSTPQGNLVYVYRVRMDVGGGNVRDVDVWVTSTDVTSLSGRSSATATGHFGVRYVDAQTGQRYSAFEFTGGTFQLTAENATNKAPAQFGLVLARPDGTAFHASGTQTTAAVVLGNLVNNL